MARYRRNPDSDGWQFLPRVRRRRTTVVEWVIVFSVIAILLRMALPLWTEWRNRSAADRIIRQLVEIESAARSALGQNDLLSLQDAPPGQIPDGLGAYLPPGFSFEHPDHAFDWDYFEVGDVLGEVISDPAVAAVGVSVPDEGLRAELADRIALRLWLVRGDTLLVRMPLRAPGG